MQAIGRILQIVGWLWFAAGIVGPVVGLDRFNFFPGLVLVFFSRIIRAQAARTASPQPETNEGEAETTPPPRPLNTERGQPSAPTPSPQVSYTPRPPVPELVVDSAEPPDDQSDLLERIVAAGREVGEEITEKTSTPDLAEPDMDRKPMTSEEMIARAHRRWDSKRG